MKAFATALFVLSATMIAVNAADPPGATPAPKSAVEKCVETSGCAPEGTMYDKNDPINFLKAVCKTTDTYSKYTECVKAKCASALDGSNTVDFSQPYEAACKLAGSN